MQAVTRNVSIDGSLLDITFISLFKLSPLVDDVKLLFKLSPLVDDVKLTL